MPASRQEKPRSKVDCRYRGRQFLTNSCKDNESVTCQAFSKSAICSTCFEQILIEPAHRMNQASSSLLPKNFKHAERGGIEVSPRLTRVASADHADLFAELKTGEQGLSEAEAQRRLNAYGPNAVGNEQHFPRLKLFIKACLNPLVILLSVLATITFATA